jgi:hypothetical protein
MISSAHKFVGSYYRKFPFKYTGEQHYFHITRYLCPLTVACSEAGDSYNPTAPQFTVFCGVPDDQSFAFCVHNYRSLFVLLSFLFGYTL